MKTYFLSVVALSLSAGLALAAGQADIAGSYSGKTAKGGLVQVTIPASGTPSYTFRGQSVPVNSAKMSGSSMMLDVGSGHGTVTLSSKGKGKLGYKYRFNGDSASATLMKQ